MRNVKLSLIAVIVLASNLALAKPDGSIPIGSENVTPIVSLEGQTPNGTPVTVTAAIIDGPAAAQETPTLIEQAAARGDLVVASDLRQSDALQNVQISAPEKNRRLGLFEIYGETRAQKVQTVLFISAQTALNTISYVYLSGLPAEPAWIITTISATLNFYFGADPERWSRILDWAQQKYRGATSVLPEKVGSKLQTPLESVGPLHTTFSWTMGWGLVTSGVSSWSNFASTFLSLETFARVASNSALGVATAGTFEALFKRWKEAPDKPLTDGQILFSRRLRALMSALIVPLANVGIHAGSVGISIMAVTGVSLYLLDFTPAQAKLRSIAQRVFRSANDLFTETPSFLSARCRSLFASQIR